MGEDPTRLPPIALEYGTGDPLPTRWRHVALWGMLAGVPLIALSLLIVAVVDIEVILLGGPVLSVVGVLLVVAGARLGDRLVLSGGLLHLVVCGGTFALIFGASLNQREAFWPVVAIHLVYGLALAALAIVWMMRRHSPGQRLPEALRTIAETWR